MSGASCAGATGFPAGALGAVHHGVRQREQRNGAAVRLTVARGGDHTAGIASLARQDERAAAMNYTQSSRWALGPAT